MSKSIGTILVGLKLSGLEKFNKDVALSIKTMEKTARSFNSIGTSLTKNFSLPFLAISGASLKLATDIDTNFNKIKNLVGVAADDLDYFKKSVRGLSGEVGKSQAELSAALFTVTSAGFKGKEGFDVLREAARLSTIGMGDTNDLARSLTGTMYSFAKSGVTANKAAAVLFKTAQLGNFEVSELAGALSGLNVMAAESGVKLEEVGALVAEFSKTGKTASQAATGFEQALAAFQKPTGELITALATMGTNIDAVRASIKERGFLATLVDLSDKAKMTGVDLSKLFGSKEAVIFAQSMLSNLGSAQASLGAYSDAINETERAYKDASEAAAVVFARSMEIVKNKMIEVGNVILPIATKIVREFSYMIERVKAVNPQYLELGLKIGLVTAALGPMLIGLSSAITTFAALAKVVKMTAVSMALLNPVGWGAALITTGVIAYQTWEPFRNLINEIADALREIDKLLSLNLDKMKTFDARKIMDAGAKLIAPGYAAMKENERLLYNHMKKIESWSGKGATGMSWTDVTSPISLIVGDDKVGKYVRNIGTNAAAAAAPVKNLFDNIATGAQKAAKAIGNMKLTDILPFGARYVMGMETRQKAERENSNFFMGGQESPGIANKAGLKLQREAIQISQLYQTQSDRSTQSMLAAKEAAVSLSHAYKSIIESGLENSLYLMAEGIGKIAAGTGSMNDMFSNLLNGLADILVQFGKLAISAGITSEAIRQAFTLTGIPAIIAGAALVALAQGVRAKAASLAPPALAEGGIAYGKTLATVGEYQGARSNPEVIAPLKKLRGMMGGGSMDVFVHTRLRGSDLLTVNERASRTYKRL